MLRRIFLSGAASTLGTFTNPRLTLACSSDASPKQGGHFRQLMIQLTTESLDLYQDGGWDYLMARNGARDAAADVVSQALYHRPDEVTQRGFPKS
jgi:hypothetical protein